MSLSKMHVRFIQSQKHFTLLHSPENKKQKLPVSRLYIKDKNTLYLLNQEEPIDDTKTLDIIFDEETHALKSLQCRVTCIPIQTGSEAFEDALLFFDTEPARVKQILTLDISAQEEKA